MTTSVAVPPSRSHSEDARSNAVAPRRQTISRDDVTGPQPFLGVFESGVVRIDELAEGDILLMLGIYPMSCLTCCCSCSPGSSHVGTMIKLDGKLWLAESASFQEKDVGLWFGADAEPKAAGVIASSVADSLKYYSAIDVYRPRHITAEQKKALRDMFCELRSFPYEKSVFQIFNVALGCHCVPFTSDSIFCSELTALMFENAGLATKESNCCFVCPDHRKRSLSYRPYDIPHIVDVVRLGRLEGTYSIYDLRSCWRCCGCC